MGFSPSNTKAICICDESSLIHSHQIIFKLMHQQSMKLYDYYHNLNNNKKKHNKKNYFITNKSKNVVEAFAKTKDIYF